MFCPHCGAECADGSKFCMNCGTPLSAPTPEPVEAPAAEQPAAPSYEDAYAPVSIPEPVQPEPVQPEPEPSYVPSGYESVSVEPIFPEVSSTDQPSSTGQFPSTEAFQPTTISASYETPAEPVDATMVRPQPVDTPQQPYYQSASSPFPQAQPEQPSYYAGSTGSYAPTQQPQYTAPQQPTYQQPTYGTQQQPQYTTPQQPGYSQQPYGQAPVTPAKKGPLQSPIVKILAGILAFVIAFFAGSSIMRGCNSDEPSGGSSSGSGSINVTVPDQPSTPESTTPEPSTPEQPSDGSGSSSGTIGGGGSSSGTIGGGTETTPEPAYPDEGFDAQGNPTAYGVVEMTGADFSAMLQENGWEWRTDKLWYASSDNNYVYVYGFQDYEYTLSDIEALDQNSGSTPTCTVIVVKANQYSSAEDCFNSLTPMVVEDIQWIDDGLAMAVVYGPSMKENVILFSYNEDEDRYVMDIFNEAAVEEGLLDEWLGDNYGHTIDELWNNLFDHSPSA